MTAVMISARRTGWALLIELIPVPILLAAGVWVLYFSMRGGSIFGMIAGAGIIVAGLAFPLSIGRYQLVVTDSYVEEIRWKSKRIEFSEVREVEMEFGCLYLKAPRKKISIDSSLTNYERILESIGNRLSAYSQVVYRGDADDLRKYFHRDPAPDTDKWIP